MTAYRTVEIECDGCDALGSDIFDSAQVARAYLQKHEGWWYGSDGKGGKRIDLCPQCLTRRRAQQ